MEKTTQLQQNDFSSDNSKSSGLQSGQALEFIFYVEKQRLMMPFPAKTQLVVGRAAFSPIHRTIITPQVHDLPLTFSGRRTLCLPYFVPFLSLTPFEVDSSSVSREHAAIYYEGRYLTLKDLNSTNGTCVNGLRLIAGREYLLHSEDQLVLGNVPMKVAFTRSSPMQLQRDHVG